MNEFKFACPNCQQNIEATPEYAGVQINCPSCQAPIVVPNAQVATAAPKPGKLTMAASTVQHTATSPVMAAAMVRKTKKPRVGLYVGLAVGVLAIVAAIIFVPKAIDKYHEHQEALAAADRAAKAAAEAAKVPPDPAMDEILRKVDDTYKALTSYSAHADSVGTMDMSEISPLLKAPQTITAKLTILLSKPNLYRIEWERQAGPTTLKGMAWSSGKGDFVRAGTASTKYKSREMALTIAAASSGTLGASLAGLFFDPTNSLANGLKNPSKGKNETINGHKCYVISGQIAFQNLKLWIRKDDFMITQAEVVLGGKIDDSMLANLPAAQKAQMMQASKIKGNIIETYQDIETNRVLNPSDFEKALAANGASGTPGNSGTPKPVRGPKDQAKGLRDRRQ